MGIVKEFNNSNSSSNSILNNYFNTFEEAPNYCMNTIISLYPIINLNLST